MRFIAYVIKYEKRNTERMVKKKKKNTAGGQALITLIRVDRKKIRHIESSGYMPYP